MVIELSDEEFEVPLLGEGSPGLVRLGARRPNTGDAQVFDATMERDGTSLDVAVKLVARTSEVAGREKDIFTAIEEARTVDEPMSHVIRCYGAAEQGADMWFVLERAARDAFDAKAWAAHRPALAWSVLVGGLEALVELRSVNVRHRDLHLNNLLVSEDGPPDPSRIRLADFGRSWFPGAVHSNQLDRGVRPVMPLDVARFERKPLMPIDDAYSVAVCAYAALTIGHTLPLKVGRRKLKLEDPESERWTVRGTDGMLVPNRTYIETIEPDLSVLDMKLFRGQSIREFETPNNVWSGAVLADALELLLQQRREDRIEALAELEQMLYIPGLTQLGDGSVVKSRSHFDVRVPTPLVGAVEEPAPPWWSAWEGPLPDFVATDPALFGPGGKRAESGRPAARAGDEARRAQAAASRRAAQRASVVGWLQRFLVPQTPQRAEPPEGAEAEEDARAEGRAVVRPPHLLARVVGAAVLAVGVFVVAVVLLPWLLSVIYAHLSVLDPDMGDWSATQQVSYALFVAALVAAWTLVVPRARWTAAPFAPLLFIAGLIVAFAGTAGAYKVAPVVPVAQVVPQSPEACPVGTVAFARYRSLVCWRLPEGWSQGEASSGGAAMALRPGWAAPAAPAEPSPAAEEVTWVNLTYAGLACQQVTAATAQGPLDAATLVRSGDDAFKNARVGSAYHNRQAYAVSDDLSGDRTEGTVAYTRNVRVAKEHAGPSTGASASAAADPTALDNDVVVTEPQDTQTGLVVYVRREGCTPEEVRTADAEVDALLDSAQVRDLTVLDGARIWFDPAAGARLDAHTLGIPVASDVLPSMPTAWFEDKPPTGQLAAGQVRFTSEKTIDDWARVEVFDDAAAPAAAATAAATGGASSYPGWFATKATAVTWYLGTKPVDGTATVFVQHAKDASGTPVTVVVTVYGAAGGSGDPTQLGAFLAKIRVGSPYPPAKEG